MECCHGVTCWSISMDIEESIVRKYKGVTMVQWDNCFQNNSFVNWTRKAIIFETLNPAQLGLTAGWQAGCSADKMWVSVWSFKNHCREVQVAKIVSTDVPDKLDELLRQQPTSTSTDTDDLIAHQLADPCLEPIILYLKDGRLLENGQQAQEIITLLKQFTIVDKILYRENSRGWWTPANSHFRFTETANDGGASCRVTSWTRGTKRN